MKNTGPRCGSPTVYRCVLAVCIVFLADHAQALRLTEMPRYKQTKHAEPVSRRLSLKLPLQQPTFHWIFNSR